jgi:hypothetical protein
MTHWHVTRHSDDDELFTADDLFSALDYAATELDQLTEFEYEYASGVASRVTGSGDVGAYEMTEALKSLARSEAYSALHADAVNMWKQHTTPNDERASLYRDTWMRDPGTTGDQRLDTAAHHVIAQINDESPLSIWPCNY